MKIFHIGELEEFKLFDSVGMMGYEGSQAPTPYIDKDCIKISFTARNRDNKSTCFTYTVDKDNPLKILERPSRPTFSPNPDLGSYYSDGFMISQYWKSQNKGNKQVVNSDPIVYFTGWERMGRSDVTYRSSCGQVIGESPAQCPFLDRTLLGPCGSSMPFRYGNEIIYMAVDKWEKGESQYYIASWYKNEQGFIYNKPLITRESNEGGLARPVRFNANINGQVDHIIFSARGKVKFRSAKEERYKMFIATKIDNVWTRSEKIDIIGPENYMECYGYPLEIGNKWYLFYNNHFKSPIQVAEIEW